MFLPGYGYFLKVAASLQWDEAGLDLTADSAAWPALPAGDRATVLRLVAGFCVGEECVARELEPFAHAAPSPVAAACFRAQAADEARHARFFDRVADEVAGVEGTRAAERREALRSQLEPAFVELFERRLPVAARGLAEGSEQLDAAVALYHLLLEGVVFTAGQHALLELLEQGGRLPQLQRGLEFVLRDERWHIGFGARLLGLLGPPTTAVSGLLDEARSAVAAWGDAVPPATAARVLEVHERRLCAAGLALRELVA